MQFVFTVCDKAAGETCPVFRGTPVPAHWGVPDPAAIEGDLQTRQAAFRKVYGMLERRIMSFVDCKLELSRREVEQTLQAIGRMTSAEESAIL
jgi:arsenate reductase